MCNPIIEPQLQAPYIYIYIYIFPDFLHVLPSSKPDELARPHEIIIFCPTIIFMRKRHKPDEVWDNPSESVEATC